MSSPSFWDQNVKTEFLKPEKKWAKEQGQYLPLVYHDEGTSGQVGKQGYCPCRRSWWHSVLPKNCPLKGWKVSNSHDAPLLSCAAVFLPSVWSNVVLCQEKLDLHSEILRNHTLLWTLAPQKATPIHPICTVYTACTWQDPIWPKPGLCISEMKILCLYWVTVQCNTDTVFQNLFHNLYTSSSQSLD